MSILLALFMLAAPTCITTGVHHFACTTMEACMGVFGDKVYEDGLCEVRPVSVKPKWHPQDTGMGRCAMDEHFHSLNMDTNAPDVRGADEPIADDLCHKDSNDLPVTPRKRLSK